MITSRSAATVTLKIDRSFERATERDFEKLLSRIRTAPCRRPHCRNRDLVGDETAAQNPNRICRSHWLADLRAEAEQEQAATDARTAREDDNAHR